MAARFALRLAAFLAPALALGAPTYDPWAKIPPLPMTCYTDDGFETRAWTIRDQIETESSRQNKVNGEFYAKQKMDSPEYMTRIQTFMMEHPSEAMQVMQRLQTAGDGATPAMLDLNEKVQTLNAERDQLLEKYKAEVARAEATMKPKFEDLDRRAQSTLIRTEAGSYYAPWAAKEYNALQAQADAAYEKICGQWWLGNGTFPAWSKRLLQARLDTRPAADESFDAGVGMIARVWDAPPGACRSTYSDNAVRDQLNDLIKLFNNRKMRPGQRME